MYNCYANLKFHFILYDLMLNLNFIFILYNLMPNLKQFGFLKENWLCIKSNFSGVGEEEAN